MNSPLQQEQDTAVKTSNPEQKAAETPQNQAKKEPSFFSEVVRFFLIVVFIIIPFRIFVAQPFIVDGASMDNTFHNGEYLIVDQVTYRFDEPERGSVLIFKYPENPSKFFIKRIIGLPGETVVIRNGKVTIKNNENPDGFELDEPYLGSEKPDTLTATLGEKEFFVMGDNRNVSSDSRYWGPVPEDNIIGRPIFRLYPITNLSVFPGDYSN